MSTVDIIRAPARFVPDATGVFAERSGLDARDQGFSFFAVDQAMVYFRLGDTAGVWSAGIAFPGEAAETGDKFYSHDQASASTEWTITHNLSKYPSVEVIDSGGNKVYGDVEYPDLDTVIVRFSVPFSGSAALN